MTHAASYVLVINDAPLDGERPYNALRLAVNLVKRPDLIVRVFLIGAGVECAVAARETAEPAARIIRMIESLVRRGAVAT